MNLLYRLAEPQAGYFTTAQAAQVGVSRQELYYLRGRGDVSSIAYGIQRLTRFPMSRHEDVIVAWLWAGADAVASHDTALVVYGIGEAMPSVIHLTVPKRFRGQRQGVHLHHAEIASDERTERDGVPITTPVRTIADVSAVDSDGARSALSDALDTGLIRHSQLQRAVARYPRLESVVARFT